MKAPLVLLATMAWLGLCVGSALPAPVVASFYDCRKPGECSRSKVTASGEAFRADGLTAAHRTLRFGTRLRVSWRGRNVTVRVNDRGPFVAGRSLDLSHGAAVRLGMVARGVATVDMEVIQP